VSLSKKKKQRVNKMKKAILALTLLCLGLFQTTEAFDVMVEGKAGGFFPSNKHFRKNYGNSGIYGGEVTIPFSLGCFGENLGCDGLADGLALFVSADYYSRKGRRHHTNEDTHHKNRNRFRIVPVAVGVKYFFPMPCFMDCLDMDLYAAIGAQWNICNFRDGIRQDGHRCKSRSKTAFGGVYKLGSIIKLPCNWFLDVFVSYANAKLHRSRRHHDVENHVRNRRTRDIGAWAVGAGIGYNFNFDTLCCY
jgi:outer membrane protein W